MKSGSLENDTVCYLCNVLDERTKLERSIHYDSPAALKKVLDVCQALNKRVNNIYVVSMGRGKQLGEKKYFPSVIKNISGINFLYARFSPAALTTYFITSISLVSLILKVLRHANGRVHVIAYNRNWLYLPSLILARILKAKCYLDLEDGTLISSNGKISKILFSMKKCIFDFICSDGALLVSPYLKPQISITPSVMCYGVAKKTHEVSESHWSSFPINFLYGGTHFKETGASLLMEAVVFLNSSFSKYQGKLKIIVSGHGPMIDDLASFAQGEGSGWIEYYGRVTNDEYENLLRRMHVGMNLRLPSFEMAKTTFPSKVIELASDGKLLLSTDLAHVKDLFGVDGAYYIVDESPESLAQTMINIADKPMESLQVAIRGQNRIIKKCNPDMVAKDIFSLFEGNK